MKLAGAMMQIKQPQKPLTPEERLAEAKHLFKAVDEEMRARGYYQKFNARMKSCNTEEERASLMQEHANILCKEVMNRRYRGVPTLMDEFLDQLDQDGKLEEIMTPVEIEFFRKSRKSKVCYVSL